MVKISIITATYNVENTISDCLRSVLSQSVDVQHIIIDGVSSDKTLDILDTYRNELSCIVSEPDNGIYDAMNKGIRMATGDVIGILNADDFYASDYVLKKVSEVFLEPTIDVCYGDLKYVDANNPKRVVRYWKSGRFSKNSFYHGWMPPHPTFFVRRTLYEKYGVFNLNMGTAADYELMLRFLLKHQAKAAYIPEVLVHMRTGGESNSSLLARLKANKMDRMAWSINGLKPYPWTIPLKPLRKVSQWFSR